MKKDKVREMTYISLCVAVMAVVSQIAIPVGAVPITIQAFVVALIGYFLGTKNGVIVVTVYILLGLVGVPVFASLQGGLHVLVGYTGGFVFGYLPFVCLSGIRGRTGVRIVLGIVGLLACHLAGTVQYMFLSDLNFGKALLVVSVPFLAKDIALVIGAYFVSETMRKRLK